MKKRRYSVDAIAIYKPSWRSAEFGKFVVIRRLNFPSGLAFPGGGIELGEDKEEAVVREVREETGLSFIHYVHGSDSEWLPKVYDKDGRDPRGPATSYVAYGAAYGLPVAEKDKTEVLFLSEEEIHGQKDQFVFDHYQMFLDYLSLDKK